MKIFIKRLISVLLASAFAFMLSFNFDINFDREKEVLKKELKTLIFQKPDSFLELSEQDDEIFVEGNALPQGCVEEQELDEVITAISEISYDGQVYEEIPQEYIDAPILEVDLTEEQILEEEVIEDASNLTPAYSITPMFSRADNEITILTPGVGGEAINWCNNGTLEFTAGTYTIIDILNGLLGGTFYRVNTKTNNGAVSYNIYSQYEKSKTTDLNQINFALHNIFIIESDSNEDYHSVVYNEFRAFLIDYLKKDVGAKVNLIGHSRGGLVNLMYASEYPHNVSRLVSIGTPYFPNSLAILSSSINALPNFWIVKNFKNWISGIAPHINAYSDLASISVSYNLLTKWNSAYNTNPSIKAYAIGTSTGYSITLYLPKVKYVKVGFIKVPYVYIAAVTLGVGIDHDGLVGTNSQLAMNIGGSYGYVQMPNSSINYAQGFYRKKLYITPGDISHAATHKKLADPTSIAVPHNMQPRYAKIIDYIYSIYN